MYCKYQYDSGSKTKTPTILYNFSSCLVFNNIISSKKILSD